MFNGKLASIHKGADFRAAMGTAVRASNSGVVVLARKLYYEGNCVIIDHGMGLFTLSMHFSRIDVHEGQRVKAGDRLGLSGATGRVTGPHLHWAVRWQGAMLDPVKLLHLNLELSAANSCHALLILVILSEFDRAAVDASRRICISGPHLAPSPLSVTAIVFQPSPGGK